ncbi:T9SS type A sorting domain-containing protein [candidate division KSB1 bacterium]|nr:T9SS type A sorting domain-containing protein [candidate division KSB1 bacterium]
MKKTTVILFISLFVASFGMAQESVELRTQYSVGGWPNCAVVAGETAFLAQSYHVAVLDLSGDAIDKIGQFDLANEPNTMAVQKDHLFAFYAFSDSSLQVVDISNPLDPVVLQRYPLSSAWPVNVSQTPSALVVATNDRVRILDTSDPTDVRVAAEIAAVGVTCAAGNDTILVVGTQDSLLIYDMSDVNALTRLYGQASPRTSTVTLQGNRAYVGLVEFPDIGVKVYDVDNPADPQELSFMGTSIRKENTTTHMNPTHIRVEDNTLTVTTAGSASLFIYDLTNIADPQQLGVYQQERDQYYQPRSIDLSLPHVYISQSNSSIPFYRLDLSDPVNPVRDALYEAPKSVTYQSLAHDTLFVTSEERLWVYQIKDPYTIELLGSSWEWYELAGLEAKNGFLYAVRNDSLFILDYSDLDNIFARGVYTTAHGAYRSVIADAERAYALTLQEFASFIEVIDVTNPDNPTGISEYDLQGEGRKLFISAADSSKLFAAYSKSAADNGVQILDLSDPADLSPLADIKTQAIPMTVWVQDSLVYIGSNNRIPQTWFLESFSIATLDQPNLVASRQGTGVIYDVLVFEERLFASLAGTIDEMPGIDSPIVVDFSSLDLPTQPRDNDQNRQQTNGGSGPGSIGVFNARDLALEGQFFGIYPLFLLLFFFGALGFLLLLAPAGYGDPFQWYFSGSLGLLALLFFFGWPTGVETQNRVVPELYRLGQNYPNPFNPQTTIEYSVAETGTVKLQVYDVQGRLVRTLVDEQKPAGNHRVDFQASGLPSGVYLYQLEVGAQVEQKRMILLK